MFEVGSRMTPYYTLNLSLGTTRVVYYESTNESMGNMMRSQIRLASNPVFRTEWGEIS